MRPALWLTLLTLAAFVSFACGQPDAAPVASPRPTSIPATPTTTPTPPTATPAPSPTPVAVDTPTPSPTPTAVPPALELGTQAPDFEVTLFDGTPLRLSDLKGEVVVLNFWASWCTPCRREMPAFEQAWQQHREQGVTFLGLAVNDFEGDARAFSEEVGVTYPLGMDVDDMVANAYLVGVMPTTYFIDREGNLARKLSGYVNQGVLKVFLAGQVQ